MKKKKIIIVQKENSQSKENVMNETLIERFEELLTLVESLRTDVVKHSGGNKSAGLRVRRGLRDAKKMASDLVRESIELNK